MRVNRQIISSLLLILASAAFQTAHAQLGFDLKIDKPKPYEERVLKAEKTGEKPLKAPKKFFQNLTTHYNYYFNASNRLNEVIESAKQNFRDDYTLLLPFYNYSLDATSQNSSMLDSVIYKSQTGIVMHDLRNDWIDNLYTLWGAAWFFEKKFDSAALMFQFINYSFAEKEKDGYYRYIGSRMDGNNALSIASAEKRNFPKNLVTPPSRNASLIWLTRSLIELGNFPEAGSLIVTLKNDPLFPKRLNEDLEEIQAYWFYKQNIWDSAAFHLVNALDQATTKQEKARWEFLAAQLFEKAGKPEEAGKYYTKSIGHTTDPVMDVYARLNLVRINKSGGENYIDKNIAELIKMAKRDKYSEYRDVIYFMAAQMEMERNNYPAAQELLLRGAKYNNGNLSSKNKSYLLIADLSFDQKKYLQAASFYDSIQSRDLEGSVLARVEERKVALKKITSYTTLLNREDSLQRIAMMPEEERTVYINRLVKQLRKQQGLGDVAVTAGNNLPVNTPVIDLFQNSQAKGEWYFYNTTLKTQGIAQFRQNWGSRPNVDNWRRFSDVNQQLLAKVPTNTRDGNKAVDSQVPLDNSPSYTSLFNNLPISETQLKKSNDSIQFALMGLGSTYMNDIEDYSSAIESFELLRKRYPSHANMNEVLFNLYYSYKKAGDDAKAEEIKRILLARDPSSRFASIITTGKDPNKANGKTVESTQAYEKVYDLFLEGKFDEAEQAKKIADSIYQTNYWQPQLLYIEAVYLVKQRNDSLAKKTLQTLISQNQNTLLAEKAQNLVDVLNRRREIEDELNRMQINRPADSNAIQQPVVQSPVPPARKDSISNRPRTDVVNAPRPNLPVDTSVKKPIVQPKPVTLYKFEPALKHYALIVLDKVDPLFVNEVKNAFARFNRDRYGNLPLQLTVQDLDAEKKLVLAGDFANAQEAMDYALHAKQLAAGEILPWLKSDKYYITILAEKNLPVFLERKDLMQYRQFLDQNLPGKF